MLAFLLVLSVLLGGKHIISGQNESVYLSLKGTARANSSNILITDIGKDDNALLCVTNLDSCCDSVGNRTGEWIFPNGSVVPIKMQNYSFYRNRGPHVVRLNRRNSILSPTGLYCCQVSDTTLRNKTVCANITTNTVVGIFMAPENFTALPTNSREIQFSWSSLYLDIEADPTSMNLSYTLTCRPYTLGVTSVIMMTYTEAGSHTLGGFRPATEYNCSVFASSSVRSGPSASINVTTMDDLSLFQLRLTGVNCSQWVAKDKLEDVTANVLENVQNLCQCGFLKDRITDGEFHCFLAPPQAVTYRAVIHGTANTNSSQLISHIERWTDGGTNLIIQQVVLRVNGSSTDAVTTLEDEECPLSNPNCNLPTASKSNDNYLALIGGALAIGIVAGVSITSFIAIIIYCVLRHRAHTVKKNAQSSPGKRIEATSPMLESGGGEMSLCDTRMHASTDPMDHEYADLQEISSKQRAQEQNAAHPSGVQPNTGGYELTRCLAYGAVAHKK